MKRATELPLVDLLAERYSPRSFLDREITEDDFSTILEAGRWSPSCFNEQPWACVYSHRKDREGFSRIFECLTPRNKKWAGRSSVLMITAARRHFDRSGKENRYASHDAGLWLMSMLVQGISLGIYGHPMAGFDSGQARTLLGIPETHEPVAAVAWGYPGPPEAVPEEFRESESVRTARRAVETFAFAGSWPQG